jgi:integrase
LIGKLAPKTIENILQTIFAILQYAETCKMRTSKVTFRDLTLGRANPAPAPFFTSAQTTSIIQAAPEPYKTLFAVASGTGVRAGELLALKVSDLDFDKENSVYL